MLSRLFSNYLKIINQRSQIVLNFQYENSQSAIFDFYDF